MSEIFIKPFQDNLSENIFTPRHTKKNSQQGTLLIIEKNQLILGVTSLFYCLVDSVIIQVHTQVLSSAFHPDFKSIIVYVSINLESLH